MFFMKRSRLALLAIFILPATLSAQSPASSPTSQGPDARPRVVVPATSPTPIPKPRVNVPAETRKDASVARPAELGNKTEIVPKVAGPAAIARRPQPPPLASQPLS